MTTQQKKKDKKNKPFDIKYVYYIGILVYRLVSCRVYVPIIVAKLIN